jgi:hypothetical protein
MELNGWVNGSQGLLVIFKVANDLTGENNYEYFRLEKRIFYCRFYYFKQTILNK